jgi:hypothetical protein
MALNAAIREFKLIYANPALEQSRQGYANRSGEYDLLWSIYANSLLDMADTDWSAYRKRYGLYRHTRAMYNPTKRLVDFYANQTYGGFLSRDGKPFPDGIPTACPFSDDTNDKLKAAVSQLWQWSNWQTWKTVHVRWGAALGDLLAEIVDDVEGGKVYFKYWWPSLVSDLTLDNRGNVKYFAVEYQVEETIGSATRRYIYRKEVDQYQTREFRDKELYNTIDHNYGFCPAVWYKHSDVGGTHGQPAIAGTMAKINELNALASQLNDQVGKVLASPMAILTDSPSKVSALFGNTKRGATVDIDGEGRGGNSDRESGNYLTMPRDTALEKLVSDLDIPGTITAMDKLYSEIEADLPEITFWSRLREMSQVTGPAAERLSGDVIGKVHEAASLYDQSNIKLFQMSVAIAGMRLAEGAGGWFDPTPAQLKFRNFNLESYAKGRLDMEIMPRLLLPPNDMERSQAEMAYWQGIQIQTTVGIPLEMVLKEKGWTDEQLAELTTLKEAAAQKQQEMFAQQAAVNSSNQFQSNNSDNDEDNE